MWTFLLQFFEELATDSKPEPVQEAAVKETQGKQVIITRAAADDYFNYRSIVDEIDLIII